MSDDLITERAVLVGAAYRTDRQFAARQALYHWKTPRRDLPGIVTALLRDARCTVADIGCGNGAYLTRLRAERPDLRVLGLDLSPGMLAGLPGPVAVADAAKLPLASASVAAALALHMLYHVPDVRRAIGELARVIRPEGLVVVSANGEGDKAELDELWRRATAGLPGIAQRPAPGARLPLERAERLLREAFGSVRTIDLSGTIAVREPGPVISHLASCRAFIPCGDEAFDAAMARARRLLAGHLDTRGVFEITSRVGFLVCRP